MRTKLTRTYGVYGLIDQGLALPHCRKKGYTSTTALQKKSFMILAPSSN